MSPNPWRYRCPKGHVQVRRRGGKVNSSYETRQWYCDACGSEVSHVRDLKKGRVMGA